MFRVDERVRLKPWVDPDDPDASSPEEFGKVIVDQGEVVLVRLDATYCDREDDGLREVPSDQVECV